MKKKTYLIVMITIAAVCLILCTFFGSVNITLGETLKILLNKFFGLFKESVASYGTKVTIIWKVRFPRSLLAFIVGGTLAICGAVYQALFKNPMADPYVLGISSGAAFGATIGILFDFADSLFGLNATASLAFAGSILAVFFVYGIAKVGRNAQLTGLLLAGTAVSQFLSAVISVLMLYSGSEMRQVYYWTLGSFNGKGWSQIAVVCPYVIIGLVLIRVFSKDMDIIMLGDDAAARYGIQVEKVKRYLFGITALMMAACVSVSGIIGFIGLVAPHVVRLFTGPRHNKLLGASFLFGGTLLMLCDTTARSFVKNELPVGIVTAMIGAPFFLYLLRKRRTEVM
ncbi:MAG: iron ABC transporter permease [Eubacteriaceae bacterium]|nr:iron ABC transporter permease [Eubacteriaceae bacterium]